jgi:hypothetical protein
MTRAGSNGGIYVLTEFEESPMNVRRSGRFPSKGFEVQVNNSHTDRIRTGSLYHVVDNLDDSPAKDDEWFTEHIIVKGDTITVNVNGKQVVHWTQPADWSGGREGPGRKITGPGTIAFQAHDPKSTVCTRTFGSRFSIEPVRRRSQKTRPTTMPWQLPGDSVTCDSVGPGS